jgi:hypothetical protein
VKGYDYFTGLPLSCLNPTRMLPLPAKNSEPKMFAQQSFVSTGLTTILQSWPGKWLLTIEILLFKFTGL